MLIFRGLPNTNDPYVKIGTFDHKTNLLFELANEWSLIHGKAVTINAVDNGIHGNGGKLFTFHGLSMAWDLGVEGNVKSDMDSLAKYLQMRLPPPYQVVIEPTHNHIEWDTGLGKT